MIVSHSGVRAGSERPGDGTGPDIPQKAATFASSPFQELALKTVHAHMVSEFVDRCASLTFSPSSVRLIFNAGQSISAVLLHGHKM